ncbi:MAG: AAA family ATPase [Rhizobiales bacterium]|nr:AAA family ATPase [Hyphomicrobiales bacterium]
MAFRLHARMILGAVAAALVVGIVIVATSRPVYQASARVLFDPRRPDTSRQASDRELVQVSIDAAQLESQIQLLKSEQVYRSVIAAHDLERDPEFARPSLSIPAWFKSLISRGGGAGSYSTVVSQFDQRLDVRRLGQSYVLQVSFQSIDPEKAARLANAVTAAYIGRQLAPRIEAARRTGQFERTMRELNADGEAAAQALKTGIIDVGSFPAADARVITAALPPTGPSAPRTSLILGLAGAIGLFIGGVAALTRFRLLNVIRERSQIEHELGLAYLGSIQELGEDFTDMDGVMAEGAESWGVNIIVDQPSAPVSTGIREIRTTFEMTLRSSGRQCIGVTSTLPGEGKTVIAYHLALAFAAAGRRTLLIDANPQNPSLTRRLAASMPDGQDSGLVQAMASGAPEGSLVATLIRGLSFLPVGRDHQWIHFSDVIDRPKGRELFEALRAKYDRIVVDLPAFSVLPDAFAMGSLLDSYILVVEAGRTRQRDAAEMVTALGSATTAIAGAVLNERMN